MTAQPSLLIAAVAAFIVVAACLIFIKRKRIARWLAGRKVGLKLKAGPVEISLDEKERRQRAGRSAGVNWGEANGFTGATISGVAGRDVRQDAAQSANGQAPGVDFGRKNRFGRARVKRVAGRDVVED
jgi:hypothetical protein